MALTCADTGHVSIVIEPEAASNDSEETRASIVKALVALLPALIALNSCTTSPDTVVSTPWLEPDFSTPTPTYAPYWDLFPVDSQPEGGWQRYQMQDLNFAFRYPSLYDESDCGRIFVAEKVVGDYAYTLIGFGGSIRIRIYEAWGNDLAEYVSQGEAGPDIQLLTGVEQFSIDGIPARRHIYRIPGEADLEYIKMAVAAFDDRLYMFQYNHPPLVICDAPPLSEEAVYDYLLSTFEFIQ
jgi:hypothetical protein